VQVVDSGAQALTADVPLADLKAGQYHVSDGQHYPWQMYRPGLAWDLAQPCAR